MDELEGRSELKIEKGRPHVVEDKTEVTRSKNFEKDEGDDSGGKCGIIHVDSIERRS